MSPSRIQHKYCSNIRFETVKTYIHHKIHRFCLYLRTHGYHGVERSFLDILSCMPTTNILFPRTVSLCLHSHLGINSLPLVEILHIQTASLSQCTDHVYRL